VQADKGFGPTETGNLSERPTVLEEKPADKPSADEWIASLSNAFPRLPEAERNMALGIYRILCQGSPLSMPMLAMELQIPVDRIIEVLNRSWGVDFDDQNRIVGYRGLSVQSTDFRLEFDDERLLYAWCAFDTLFLPGILFTRARVESFCPATGLPIRLIVGPDNLELIEPEHAVMSFLIPEADRVKESVTDHFCDSVRFFHSDNAGLAWTSRRPGTILLSIDQAHTLGKEFNKTQFPRS
jgi:alkylmercury lyase